MFSTHSALPATAGVAGEATFPEILLLAQVPGHPAAQNEEEITQAVDVLERPLADGVRARGGQELPLGATAHRPRLVQEGVDAAAAGEREGLERLELLLTAVHEVLESRHFRLADVAHPLVLQLRRGSQLASQIEELVLDFPQHLVEPAMVFAFGQPLRVE